MPFFIGRLLDYYLELQAVRDVADYLNISILEAVRRAREKNTQAEDRLWNEFQRVTKSDYREYYARNLHYLERQDWYNRNPDLGFLDYITQYGKMLDYGCGTAYVSFKAKQKRPDIKIHLADIPQALTKKFAKWRFEKYNISYTWYDIPENEVVHLDEDFDFIRCHDVLEHTFHPDMIIQTFWVALKPGGTLSFDFIYDPNCSKENTRRAQELRDTTLEYVKCHFQVLSQNEYFYLVRKR